LTNAQLGLVMTGVLGVAGIVETFFAPFWGPEDGEAARAAQLSGGETAHGERTRDHRGDGTGSPSKAALRAINAGWCVAKGEAGGAEAPPLVTSC
jgi:hypothetical protein